MNRREWVTAFATTITEDALEVGLLCLLAQQRVINPRLHNLEDAAMRLFPIVRYVSAQACVIDYHIIRAGIEENIEKMGDLASYECMLMLAFECEALSALLETRPVRLMRRGPRCYYSYARGEFIYEGVKRFPKIRRRVRTQ